MSGNIFVSYRRDDSKHAAGRLVDRLQAEFGSDQLFMDVDSIELGLDFVQVINDRVAACDVMLVIMGPNWVSAADGEGNRRLDNLNDFVRLEVEAALEREIRVIPVLVDGAQPPRAEDLPPTLAPLANRQATRLDHISFAADAEHLTKALVRISENTASPLPDSVSANRPEPDARLREKRPSFLDDTTEPEPPEETDDGLLDDIAESETHATTTQTQSDIEIIGISRLSKHRPGGGDAPRMTRAEARKLLRETDDTDSGIDKLGWAAALSPLIFGAILIGTIVLFDLQPAHFAWFGLPGEKVAFALPIVGALMLWTVRRVGGQRPITLLVGSVGGLLVAVNMVVVILAD